LSVDLALIEAARGGEVVALERLLTASRVELRRYAQRSCMISDIDDAVQEALLIASRSVRLLRHARAWSSWMFKIVRRECHRLARAALRVDLWDDAAVDVLVAGRVDHELRREVAAALESLPETYREVIVRRDLEEMTIGEIARELGCSTAAVKGRLHRARQLTRE
jgi:RNA polymerase sigma factor (sigma-70 family)